MAQQAATNPIPKFNADEWRAMLERPDLFIKNFVICGREDETGRPITVQQEQARALLLLANGKWPVIRAGRGVGKTTLLAWIIIWWLFTHDTAKIGAISVKREQLADALWPEIKRWLVGSVVEPAFEWQKEKVFIVGCEQTRFAVARTGSSVEALQGLHDPHLLVIIEEASGVEQGNFDALVGSLTQANNALVMAGNPTRSDGAFHRISTQPTRPFVPIKIPCVDSDGNRHPLVQQAFIDMMRSRYGERSNQYRVYVQGEFPSAEDDKIIPWEWVNDAVENVDLEADPVKYRVIWGLDVARFGDDETVLVKRVGPVVPEPPKRWRGKDTMQVVGAVMLEYNDTADEQKPDRLYVDDIGVGGGVVDRLREQGVPVSGVTVSRLPPVRMAEKCYRLRDELWWRGREFFQGRNVRIPREEGLLAELTTPTYDIRSDGRIHVESKADFKKRLPDRGSPDSADAFLLTFMSQNDTVTTGQREQRSGKYRRRKKILSWMAA